MRIKCVGKDAKVKHTKSVTCESCRVAQQRETVVNLPPIVYWQLNKEVYDKDDGFVGLLNDREAEFTETQIVKAFDAIHEVVKDINFIKYNGEELEEGHGFYPISFKEIDGPSGTLGRNWFPLEFKGVIFTSMELDLAENWTPKMMFLVILHEAVHGLGLDHLFTSRDALMAPVYDSTLDGLQEADIEHIGSRYELKTQPKPETDDSWWVRLFRSLGWL